ncbi:ROK family protein [uncultured Amnibacterium sp.]|uniref:ROK family protein n=1 Tax=uncultured Amnibacterium sp. TaxID=1631851 RepID=UPI0035CBE69C
MPNPEPRGRSGGSGRRHNLALVLQRVHAAPLTRSELTRVSGLNRSTVGALVADLAARGLVVEDPPSALGQVGRPSPLVRAGEEPVAVAVNPEVDAITVALVRLGGEVVAVDRTPFPAVPDVEDAVEASGEALARLLAASPHHRPVGAGVAVPGVVSSAEGLVRLAPHLGWRDVPLADRLAERIALPVAVANDATLGARAEWLFGAGRGVGDLVYLYGGAGGIGGGIVAGGVPLAGATGHAGELGHAIISSNGVPDTLGVRGTLESAVQRVALLEVLGLQDAPADRLEASLLAAADEPRVAAEVGRQVEALAVAIANAVTVLNPARVILGGFLSALAAVAGERLDRLVAERALPGIGERVEIRRSELGSRIPLIGAAELAFAPLLADPAAYRH